MLLSSGLLLQKPDQLRMIAHQLVRGLAEEEMQEQVLAHAATNPDMDLAAIFKFKM